MNNPEGLLDRLRALVASQPSIDGDKPGTIGSLQRLCRAAANSLPATGVGVSVVTAAGNHVRAAASDITSDVLEELQFTTGEGPCIDSFASRRPVLTDNLAAHGMTRWPGYGPAAHAEGVRAVFAFPLQLGTARLGVMDVYRDRVGPLSPAALAEARSFAELALQTLVDSEQDTAEAGDDVMSRFDEAGERRFEVFQAQGMVMIQLGVDLEEAMARLRAYAYRHDRRLQDVARAVLARSLDLARDY